MFVVRLAIAYSRRRERGRKKPFKHGSEVPDVWCWMERRAEVRIGMPIGWPTIGALRMKKIRCEGCGQKVLERALTRAAWIKSDAGAPLWCADCVFSDPPPRAQILDHNPAAEPAPSVPS
jgi:hypothetical protein